MPRRNISKTRRTNRTKYIVRLKRQLREIEFKRYYIQYSWKHGYPIGDPHDWRSWRTFAVVPILFHTYEEADAYLQIHAFKNMNYRKLTASIESKWLDK